MACYQTISDASVFPHQKGVAGIAYYVLLDGAILVKRSARVKISGAGNTSLAAELLAMAFAVAETPAGSQVMLQSDLSDIEAIVHRTRRLSYAIPKAALRLRELVEAREARAVYVPRADRGNLYRSCHHESRRRLRGERARFPHSTILFSQEPWRAQDGQVRL